MPDTPITDDEFIANAARKAKTLRLNSFLLWNVSTAVLYVSENLELYEPVKSWDDLGHITTREQVEPHKREWVKLLGEILRALNGLFEDGTICSKPFVETFSDNTLVDIILSNMGGVAACLERQARRNGRLDARINLWWRSVRAEQPKASDRWAVLARNHLVNWVNKIAFAHLVKAFHAAAKAVESIDQNTSPAQARDIFKGISRSCDFWTVFEPANLGEQYLGPVAWSQLVQINGFLSEIHFEEINQALLQAFLEATLLASKRKAAGQYATPQPIADLLVRLTVLDKELAVYDPFCGTGTIGRAAVELKTEYGIRPQEASGQTWASDKFSFPLQIATLSLSRAGNMGQLLNVFKMDALKLRSGLEVRLADPNDGQPVMKTLPSFKYIASNLPFVQQEDVNISNPGVRRINATIRRLTKSSYGLDGRSDLCAYLPFCLWQILAGGGRLGIILSNAWLGTRWGRTFREQLAKFYHIESVITSARGRWFENSAVVTNIVVLNRRDNVAPPPDEEQTTFATTSRAANDWEDPDRIRDIASSILAATDLPGEVEQTTYTRREIEELETLGFEWSALFCDPRWFRSVAHVLVPASNLFEINRGERRGWDDMFFPARGHGIERQYVKPVLISPRSVSGLMARPDGQAFCCSETLASLKRKGHQGALAWIRRFRHATNTTGQPLPKALRRGGLHWYEMRPATTADLVASVDYGDRLFIAKMRKRSFVNQRLIRFTLLDSATDIDLCHALLNSLVGVFLLEALGFGRGLGALDLNPTKVRENLRMLDPEHLSANQKDDIKQKFRSLLKRDVMDIPQELANNDRRRFDRTVLRAFGLSGHRDAIEASLKRLYRIRTSVAD